jgi:C4-dicarboxylate transporter
VLLKYINSNSLAVASESLVGQADNEAVSSAPTLGALVLLALLVQKYKN